MRASPSIFCRRTTTGVFRAAYGLLPTAGPTMLRDTFPALLDGQAALASDAIWETSRFGVDLCTREAKTAGEHRNSDVRTLRRHNRVRLDAATQRYRHRDGRPNGADSLPRSLASETFRRAAADRRTIAVAGYLEVSRERLRGVREAGGLSAPAISDVGARVGRFTQIEAMETEVA
jgi:acyl homoserine lactone synthase